MSKTLEKIAQWVVWPAVVGVGVYFLTKPATNPKPTIESCIEEIKTESSRKKIVQQYPSKPEQIEKIDQLADYIKNEELAGLETLYSKVEVPRGLIGPEEVQLNYLITGDYRLITLTSENGENYLIRIDDFLGDGNLSLLKSKKMEELIKESHPIASITLPPKINYNKGKEE